MLYLVFNKSKQATWQSVYEQTYVEMLHYKGIPYKICNLEELPKTTKSDFIWIMHFSDLNTIDKAYHEGKVLFRMSGTATHPFCYQVDYFDEDKQLKNIIDINMTFCPRMSEYVNKFYPEAKCWATGFPIEVREDIHPKQQRTKEILISGRMSQDKQPMLAMYLLRPLVDEYKITFCYPSEKEEKFFEDWGGKERWVRYGFNFECLDKSEWLGRASNAEFIFTASLGDTACVSVIEAITLGCYPLVPNYKTDLPTFDMYVNNGYEPYSQKDILRLVKEKPDFVLDDTWYNPIKWADRFKEMLDFYKEK